ncbi:MAG: DUF2917 domain-containing protein [Chloroflexi bacterium]|nr:DUF2917 domain-containing protein [Chloroflexota bacterium]
MNLTRKHPTNLSIQLHRTALQHLSNVTPGMTVICEKGLVLLTEPNDLRDYTLRPGHNVVIRKRGDVLIEAMDDASVSIIYPN